MYIGYWTLNKYYYYYYYYTRWRSIWPVKQILNYQMRSDVNQNAIICIRQIKNLCDNSNVIISVVDENVNEDVSSNQSTCSLLDFSYFSVFWFLESGIRVDTVHVARVIFNYFGWYISDTFYWSMLHNN